MLGCGLNFPALWSETRKQRFTAVLQSLKSVFGRLVSQGRRQTPWPGELALEEAPRLWERGRGPSSRPDHHSVVPNPSRARCHRCHPGPRQWPLINPSRGPFERRPQTAPRFERAGFHLNHKPAKCLRRAEPGRHVCACGAGC